MQRRKLKSTDLRKIQELKVDKNPVHVQKVTDVKEKRVSKMSRRDYAITRREDTINYTVKDVEEADEDEVFDIGDDLEVDLSGLTDMDGIRQRIIMHIEKVKGNYKDQVGRLACCQLHHRRRNWGQEGT